MRTKPDIRFTQRGLRLEPNAAYYSSMENSELKLRIIHLETSYIKTSGFQNIIENIKTTVVCSGHILISRIDESESTGNQSIQITIKPVTNGD
jgi:hypothetical protein